MNDSLTEHQKISIFTADIERYVKQKAEMEKQIAGLAEKYNDTYRRIQQANQIAETIKLDAEAEGKKLGSIRLQIQGEKKEIADLALKASLAKDEVERSREALRKDRSCLNQDIESFNVKSVAFIGLQKELNQRELRLQADLDELALNQHKLQDEWFEVGVKETSLDIKLNELNGEKLNASTLREKLEADTQELDKKRKNLDSEFKHKNDEFQKSKEHIERQLDVRKKAYDKKEKAFKNYVMPEEE